MIFMVIIIMMISGIDDDRDGINFNWYVTSYIYSFVIIVYFELIFGKFS